MFTRALIRRPAASLSRGLSSSPELGLPLYDRALIQHAAYQAALERCGLEVEVLEADERYPDSCFVEDVAICTPSFALVTRPGAPTRRGETEGMERILARHYAEVAVLEAPGTLEGGDVMMVGRRCYIGLSKRTNAEGARQLTELLARHGMEGLTVPLRTMLHLKTGLAYLEEGILLAAGEFLENPLFSGFTRIPIPPEESYAANCIRVNDYVLAPAGFPETARRLRDAGLRLIELDTSEYRKLDGGLSCLSLRF